VTEALEIALIAGAPPTLLGIATLVSALKNGQKSEKIHTLVNSKMTAALERIAQLEAQLKRSADG
jgi:hypothetical protein